MAMVPCATALALCLALLPACLAHGQSLGWFSSPCWLGLLVGFLGVGDKFGAAAWMPLLGAQTSHQRFGAGLLAHCLPFAAGWEPTGSARGTSLACPHW